MVGKMVAFTNWCSSHETPEWGEKTWKEKKSHLVYFQKPPPTRTMIFLKYAQDDLQGRLRSCISQPVNSYHYGCQALSQQGCTATSLWSFPQRDRLWDQIAGTLESEDIGPFNVKLLLFSHLRYFCSWNLRLCGYLRSNHICLVEINNQVFYSCRLDENSNGNGIWGVGAFLLEYWWIDGLCSSERLKVLWLTLCTQSKVQTGWIVLYKASRANYCFTDHAFILAPQVI